MKIGIAGTGRMGTAIAQRLLDVGHEVSVWNRTVDNAQRGTRGGSEMDPDARRAGERIGSGDFLPSRQRSR